MAETIRLLAEYFGVPPSCVNDATDLAGGKERFQFYTVDVPAPIGLVFLKTTSDSEKKQALRREAEGMVVASLLQIPTLPQCDFPDRHYDEAGEIGLFATGLLPRTEYLFSHSIEQLHGLSIQHANHYARAGAAGILTMSGRELPDDVTTDLFLHSVGAAPQFRTIDPLLERLTRIAAAVYAKLGVDFEGASSTLCKMLRGRIEQEVSEVSRFLTEVATGTKGNALYLYHGDFAPNNIALAVDGRFCIFDFEYVSVTRIREFAIICDLANFFARCWPNRWLQRQFLVNVAGKLEGKGDMKYELLRAAIVFGTLGLSQYKIKAGEPEADMARTLLSCFIDNLKLIDDY